MKIYYVYAYCYPNIKCMLSYENIISFLYLPFYIGKGCDNRIDVHEKICCKKIINGYSHVSKKEYEIIKLLENDLRPIKIIIYETYDENEAYELETKIVDFFGRISEGGILTNVIRGGKAAWDNENKTGNKNSFFNKKHSDETKQKIAASYKDWYYNKIDDAKKLEMNKKRSLTCKKYWDSLSPEDKLKIFTNRNNSRIIKNHGSLENYNNKKEIKKLEKQKRLNNKNNIKQQNKLKLKLRDSPKEIYDLWLTENRRGVNNPMAGKGELISGLKNGRAKIVLVYIDDYVFKCSGTFTIFGKTFKNYFKCNDPFRAMCFVKKHNVKIIDDVQKISSINNFIEFKDETSFIGIPNDRFKKCKARNNQFKSV